MSTEKLVAGGLLAAVVAYGGYAGCIDVQTPHSLSDVPSTVHFDNEAFHEQVAGFKRQPTPTEAPKPPTHVPATLDPVSRQKVIEATVTLGETGGIRCPEQPKFQFFMTKEPNSNICLALDTVRVDSDGKAIFTMETNPASDKLVDLPATLNTLANAKACAEVKARLKPYANDILYSTGLDLAGKPAVAEVIVMNGRQSACDSFEQGRKTGESSLNEKLNQN